MSTVELRFVTETTDTFAGIKIPDLISMGIRDITWSPYSHVEFVLDSDWAGALYTFLLPPEKKNTYSYLNGYPVASMTLGARHSDGVKIRKSNYEKFSIDDRFLVEVTPEQKDALIEFAFAQVGKPYDTTAILGILAHRDWREPDSWFCSELVTAAFEAAGAPILYVPQHVNRITPRDASLSVRLVPKPKV